MISLRSRGLSEAAMTKLKVELTGVWFLFDFLLAIAQREELESVRNIAISLWIPTRNFVHVGSPIPRILACVVVTKGFLHWSHLAWRQ